MEEIIRSKNCVELNKFLNKTNLWDNSNIFDEVNDINLKENQEWFDCCVEVIKQQITDNEEVILELIERIELSKDGSNLKFLLSLLKTEKCLVWVLASLKRLVWTNHAILPVIIDWVETGLTGLTQPYEVSCFLIQLIEIDACQVLKALHVDSIEVISRLAVKEKSGLLPDDLITEYEELSLDCASLFVYAVLVDQIIEYPRVYDPTYIYYIVLKSWIHLFENDINKGLSLSQIIINSLPKELAPDILEPALIAHLTNIMIHDEDKSNRMLAKTIFDSFHQKLSQKSQYLLLLNIPQVCTHSGLISILITKFKDSNFTPEQLKLVIFKYGQFNDLVSQLELILSLLNLLIYAFLSHNGKIWDYVDLVDRKLLIPLMDKIKLEKEEYELKKMQIAADGDGGKKVMDVMVGGMSLPEMGLKEQIAALDSALNGLFMMDNLVMRIKEIINK